MFSDIVCRIGFNGHELDVEMVIMPWKYMVPSLLQNAVPCCSVLQLSGIIPAFLDTNINLFLDVGKRTAELYAWTMKLTWSLVHGDACIATCQLVAPMCYARRPFMRPIDVLELVATIFRRMLAPPSDQKCCCRGKGFQRQRKPHQSEKSKPQW